MIYWIGNSENWDKPRHSSAGNMVDSYAFPLVEETVLETAFSPLYMGYGRLSKEAAINCTSRFALRMALPAELNPEWMDTLEHFGLFFDGLVVKAPASCQNQGIGFALPNEYSRRLAQYDPEMAVRAILEEYIPGPQYEADGIVVDGRVHLLAWTRQEGENGKIVRYRSSNLIEAPAEVIEIVVKALGLDHCPFCFEMKRETLDHDLGWGKTLSEQGQWKIIDAHARLGEDRRLWTNQADLFDRIDKIIQGR